MNIEDVNPLLASLKIPGRTFPLPSSSFFYTNDVLSEDAAKTGEIQVFPMSGLAELKFRTPDMLFSGKAVTEVIRECIPAILKPEKLISRDVDTILSYIRIVTYGPLLDVVHKHNCPTAREEHTYQVNLESVVNQTKVLTKDQFDLLFDVKLSNNQNIKLKPLVWEDAVQILQKSSKEGITSAEVDEFFVFNKVCLIDSMDGVVDKKLISEWVRFAPAPYIDQIQITMNNAMEQWGTKFVAPIKCLDCGEELQVELDLNQTSFFSH
jgi:hypothetical protein